jgi:hypothetical protein
VPCVDRDAMTGSSVFEQLGVIDAIRVRHPT